MTEILQETGQMVFRRLHHDNYRLEPFVSRTTIPTLEITLRPSMVPVVPETPNRFSDFLYSTTFCCADFSEACGGSMGDHAFASQHSVRQTDPSAPPPPHGRNRTAQGIDGEHQPFAPGFMKDSRKKTNESQKGKTSSVESRGFPHPETGAAGTPSARRALALLARKNRRTERATIQSRPAKTKM